MFKLNYLNYVGKSDFDKKFEKAAFEFVRSLEKLQACQHAITKNIRVVNPFISNLSNFHPEVYSVKQNHVVMCKLLTDSMKNHYVVAHDLVECLQNEFNYMKSISNAKSAILRTSVIKDSHDRLPIELFNTIIKNDNYKLVVEQLLNEYVHFDQLIITRTKFFKSINYYLNNLKKLQKTVLANFSKSGKSRDAMASNSDAFLIKQIGSQVDYFTDLISDCSKVNNDISDSLDDLMKLRSEYRKNNRIDPNFYSNYVGLSTWKDLLTQYERVKRALDTEISRLSKEHSDFVEREKMQFSKNLFVRSNPKVVHLAAEKSSLLDLMSNKYTKTKVILTEIEDCMLKNGDDLKICVRNLKGVKSNNSSKIDEYINRVKKHQKYGEFYAELFLTLKKEKERIEKEATQKELNSFLLKQYEFLSKANTKRREAEREAKKYERKLIDLQRLYGSSNIGPDIKKSVDKLKLDQQELSSRMLKNLVAKDTKQSADITKSMLPDLSNASSTYYKYLSDSWQDQFPSYEKKTLANYVSPETGISVSDRYNPAGGAAYDVYLYERLTDNSFIENLHMLKSFLSKKYEEEREKISPYERSELKLLMIELKISKYYEKEISKMLGGIEDVTLKDVLKVRSNYINYTNIVQRIEVFKVKYFHLLNHMTAYFRKQMEYMRSFYKDTEGLINKQFEKLSSDPYTATYMLDIKNTFESSKSNPRHDFVIFFRGFNRVKSLLGAGDTDTGNVSYPYILTELTNNFNKAYDKVKDLVVEFDMSAAQYNDYNNKIVALETAFGAYRNAIFGEGGLSGDYTALRNYFSLIQNNNDLVTYRRSNGLLEVMRVAAGHLNDFHARIGYVLTRHDLFKKSTKKYNASQLLRIKSVLSRWAEDLSGYYKTYLDKCMKYKKCELDGALHGNNLKGLNDHYNNINSQVTIDERKYKRNDVIERIRKINKEIEKHHDTDIGRTDYDAQFKMTERVYKLRVLQNEKLNLIDYLSKLCVSYDTKVSELIKTNQKIINKEEELILNEFYCKIPVGVNITDLKEYINFMRHKFKAYHDHLYGSGLYEASEIRSIGKLVYNVEKTINNVMNLCESSFENINEIVVSSETDYSDPTHGFKSTNRYLLQCKYTDGKSNEKCVEYNENIAPRLMDKKNLLDILNLKLKEANRIVKSVKLDSKPLFVKMKSDELAKVNNEIGVHDRALNDYDSVNFLRVIEDEKGLIDLIRDNNYAHNANKVYSLVSTEFASILGDIRSSVSSFNDYVTYLSANNVNGVASVINLQFLN